MKKFILFFSLPVLLSLAAGVVASAQSETAVVKEIRTAYAAAKEQIKLTSGVEGTPRNDATATIHCNVPGTGPRTEVVHWYFDLETNEDGARYQPYFITRKYNVAARDFYEEYLFDAGTARLLFVFIQSDNFEGGKNEERYYFDAAGKIVSRNVKGGETVSADALPDQAARIRSLVPQYLDFIY